MHYQVRAIAVRPANLDFPHARKLIEVIRHCIEKKDLSTNGAEPPKMTQGRRLYLSSDPDLNPQLALTWIRQRWSVENKNHHVRDTAFNEDACRCRVGNSAANLALLRGAVLNLWRKHAPDLPARAFLARNEKNLASLMRFLN